MKAEFVLERVKGYIDGTMVTLEDNMESSPFMSTAQLDILREIRDLITKLEEDDDVRSTLKEFVQRVKTLEMDAQYMKKLHGDLINTHADHLDRLEKEVFGEILEHTEMECEA